MCRDFISKIFVVMYVSRNARNYFLILLPNRLSRGNASDICGRYSVRNSSGTPAILLQGFRVSPQSVQANAGLVPLLYHDHFLPSPSQFIIHLLPYHPTQYSYAPEKGVIM
jgi:hypothetical protein